MVKKGFRGFLYLLVFFLLLFLPDSSFARSRINSIDIDCRIDSEGNGHFKEVWQVDFDEDDGSTEIFRPMQDISPKSLDDFSVSQDGKPLKMMDSWDPDLSFDEKAGRYGINYLDSGFELCFGLGQYGPTSFTLNYVIEGLVEDLSDYQAIYWKFVNDQMDPAADEVNLEISSENSSFDFEDERIWSFGFKGESDIRDGKILLKTDEPLSYDDEITMLIRFPKGTFQTFDKRDFPFDDYVKQAFKGSSYDYNNYDPNATYEDLKKGDQGEDKENFIVVIVILIFFVFFIFFFVSYRRNKKKYYPSLKKIARNHKGEYERELPLSAFESYQMLSLMDIDGLGENYLSAGLLSLIYQDYILAEEKNKGLGKRREKYFKINEKESLPQGPESILYQLLSKASDEGGYLSSKDFSKYIRNNYKEYEKYERSLASTSTEVLYRGRYFSNEEERARGLEAYMKRFIEGEMGYSLTEKGKELRENIGKYYNYLNDFSLINERSAYEVHLWDHILIMASALGIADKVLKQFKEIYPDYVEESHYLPWTYSYVNSFGKSAYSSYSSALSSYTSSSGGGGFSSMGGGFGAGGGASGGGGR